MHDVFKAVILGIIEGLTEFVPVSSTGHMILAQPLLGIDPQRTDWKTLLWVSQLAAILAVLLYFWRDLWVRTFGPSAGGLKNHLMTKLLVAMVPTVVLALLLHDYAEKYLENPPAVASALIVGGIAMLVIERRCRREAEMDISQVTLRQAFLIGVIQCLSMWSGISRSGASIMGGLGLGLTPRVATQFSFYLAIPTMLAAAAKTLWEERKSLDGDSLGIVAVGSAAAFVTALLVVASFLEYVKSKRFAPFAVYRIVLGAVVLGWFFVNGK